MQKEENTSMILFFTFFGWESNYSLHFMKACQCYATICNKNIFEKCFSQKIRLSNTAKKNKTNGNKFNINGSIS